MANSLLNHTALTTSIFHHTSLHAALLEQNPRLPPYILGEANSIMGGGANTISNSFGAALWSMNFLLHTASCNISRVHLHNGRPGWYNAFWPFPAAGQPMDTRPPYYGQLAAAALLGNLSASAPGVTVSELKMDGAVDAGYAAHVAGRTARLALINLREYNYSALAGPTASRWRPVHRYSLLLPADCRRGSATVHMLMGNGSNVLGGASFDGYSYDYGLEQGRGVRVDVALNGQVLRPDAQGTLVLDLPNSSAAVLTLGGCDVSKAVSGGYPNGGVTKQGSDVRPPSNQGQAGRIVNGTGP